MVTWSPCFGPVAAQDVAVEGCGREGLLASWQLRNREARKGRGDPTFPQRLKTFWEALPTSKRSTTSQEGHTCAALCHTFREHPRYRVCGGEEQEAAREVWQLPPKGPYFYPQEHET